MNPKELNRLYNLTKIQCNPTGYSFKDRIIICNDNRVYKKSISKHQSYTTEAELLRLINASKPIEMNTISSKSFCTSESFITINNVLRDSRLYAVYDPRDYDNMLYKNGNIYIDERFLAKYPIEHYIKLMYLMTTTKSNCSYLKWGNTDLIDKYNLDELISYNYLKDALEKESTLYVVQAKTPFSKTFVPANPKYNCVTGSKGFPNSTGLKPEKLTILEDCIDNSYKETIAYGMEILYLVNTLNMVDRNNIFKMLQETLNEWEDPDSVLCKIGKLKGSEIVPIIELSENPKERFYQIWDYIHKPDNCVVIRKYAHEFVHNIKYTSLNEFYSVLINFGMDLNTSDFKINQFAILYNYLKASKKLDELNKICEDVSRTIKEIKDSFTRMEDISISDSLEKFIDEHKLEKFGDTEAMDIPGLSHPFEDLKKSKETESHDSPNVSAALDGLIGNFKEGKYHVTIKDVSPTNDEAAKAKYNAIANKVKLINTELIKQIREIKTYNTGGKNAGQRTGKLDRKAIWHYKTNPNIFYQNTYKQKECDPAFGIMLDASGSMYGSGIENGKITMIVLHETFKALGINHCIMDHTSYHGKYYTDIRRYQCFKEDKGYKLLKNYSLAEIEAESGNCDSGALWFMEKALLRTKNRDKICMIFSDGAPTECSKKDLIDQVRHMEHNGIKVIGIGINFENIKEYYADYANGKNLKGMLNIVTDILKEYVLEKKE